MAASIYDWSLTPASNGNSDADSTWSEGQAPSTVNNTGRSDRTRVRQLLTDIGGSLPAGGTANGLTVTAASPFTALSDGMIIAFRATASNSGAATLNVNSIGAKAIRKMDATGDVALAANEIRSTGIYVAQYSAALNGLAGAWLLVNPTPANFVTLTGVQTLTNKTLSQPVINTPTLVLAQGANPTPTAEGDTQWDTDDNAFVVGDGAGQKIFRQTSYELVSKGTASAVASVGFTGLSAYRALRLTLRMAPATDSVAALLRTSSNNGSSYDAGAADYLNQQDNGQGAGVTATSSTFTAYLIGYAGVGNAAEECIAAIIDLFEFNQASHCQIVSDGFLIDAAGNGQRVFNGGRRSQATARDALQVLFASGNIAAAHYTLEGLRG